MGWQGLAPIVGPRCWHPRPAGRFILADKWPVRPRAPHRMACAASHNLINQIRAWNVIHSGAKWPYGQSHQKDPEENQ